MMNRCRQASKQFNLFLRAWRPGSAVGEQALVTRYPNKQEFSLTWHAQRFSTCVFMKYYKESVPIFLRTSLTNFRPLDQVKFFYVPWKFQIIQRQKSYRSMGTPYFRYGRFEREYMWYFFDMFNECIYLYSKNSRSDYWDFWLLKSCRGCL